MKIKLQFLSTLTLCFSLLLSMLLPAFVSAETVQTTFIPWSGYWWPFNGGGLGTGLDYRGKPAPLEKYNLLTKGTTAGEALTEYLNAYYDPAAPGWYGLCPYWARAAGYEHIVFLPSSEDNVIFRVGDKKGLLTLVHSNDIVDYADGSRPEIFHFWLLNYIHDQKMAFVADLDPGTEVWSYPIYKYDMESSRAGNVQSVSVKIYFASDIVPPDYMGTKTLTASYTYDLFLDADGAITGGQWTGGSGTDHPNVLSFTHGVRTAFPGLDYLKIKQLAESKDDYLEKGSQRVEIGPGTYNLVLLDEDIYGISARVGDTLSLKLEKEQGSYRDIEAVIIDGDGNEVKRAIVVNGSPLEDIFTCTKPPYTLHVTQDDYTDPNIYRLKVDLRKAYSQDVPYIPSRNEWSGFALTNPANSPVDGVTLTTRGADGVPMHTVLGPLRLEPGEKRLFFYSDLPVRLSELYMTEKLALAADGTVAFLNLIGDGDNFLTTIIQGEARGSHLVIPDTVAPMTPGATMIGGVRNDSFEDAPVSLRLYSAAGILQKEVTQTIAARGELALYPGEYPFYTMPKSGWIEILGSGSQLLSGFQYTSNPSGVETLFALPVGAVRKIVPHIPEPGGWITNVTLINPNDADNPVRLHLALAGADTTGDLNIVLAPREKRVIEIGSLFGKRAGEPLYHSILEITGGLSPLVGYYTYSLPDGNDNASYPLLDESAMKDALTMPHYPGNGFWWTGVVVCNPSTAAETVRVEPYDQSGKLMEGHVLSVNLNAGAYDVFDVASRLGEVAASEISFVRFRTDGDSGSIGGFYLYGNAGSKILSGANM